MLDKTLESLLDNKEIKPLNPKGNQARLFIGGSNAEAPIRVDSLGKTLMPGKIKGKRRRGQQRMRWLDSTTNSFSMLFGNEFEQTIGDSGRQESVMLQSKGSQRIRHDLVTEQVTRAVSFSLHL